MMSDRETKLRELLERRADEFPPTSKVPPGLVQRARRGMVATGLAVCLVAAGIGFGAFAGVRAIRSTVVPASPTASVSLSPSLSHTAPVSPTPAPSESPSLAPLDVKGVKLVLPLDGSVGDVRVGDGALYAVYTPMDDGDHQVIARMDLRTGAVVESASLSPGVRLALTGGYLWITQWNASNPDVRVMDRLDPGTLAGLGSVPVPGSPSQLVPAPTGLWVGSGTRVYLLDPSDGHVIRSAKLDGQAGAMSVDPQGRLLYVSTSVPGNIDPRSLYELDAATGAVRAKVSGPVGLLVSGVSATANGVWVAVATGLMCHVELHSSTDLRLVANFGEHRGAPVTNSINAAVADDILWVTDSMIGVVACADPRSGRLRSIVIPQSDSGIISFGSAVSAGSDVYLGIDRGVIRITPSAGCHG